MNDKNSLLSVVVPIYNCEKYLHKCIESLLHQTILNVQIILVDDGSTDNSALICDNYAKEHSNVQVIHKLNGGPASARLLGAQKSHTKYITFVDGDDWVRPEMYEKMINLCESEQVDLVECAYLMYDEAGERFGKAVENDIPAGYHEVNRGIVEAFVSGKMIQSTGTKVYKRAAIEQCIDESPMNLKLGEDGICNFRYLNMCCNMYSLQEPLYCYRQHRDSLTHIENFSYFENVQLYYSGYKAAIIESVYADSLLKLLENKIAKLLVNGIYRFPFTNKYDVLQYRIDAKLIPTEKIALYGAGKVGRDIYEQLSNDSKIQIVFWTDKNWENLKNENPNLQSLSLMRKWRDITVLIAVENGQLAEQIKRELKVDYNINEDNIVWIQPQSCIIQIE